MPIQTSNQKALRRTRTHRSSTSGRQSLISKSRRKCYFHYTHIRNTHRRTHTHYSLTYHYCSKFIFGKSIQCDMMRVRCPKETHVLAKSARSETIHRNRLIHHSQRTCSCSFGEHQVVPRRRRKTRRSCNFNGVCSHNMITNASTSSINATYSMRRDFMVINSLE